MNTFDLTIHLNPPMAAIAKEALGPTALGSDAWVRFNTIKSICLDGDFSLAELEQIVACMRQMEAAQAAKVIEREL